MQQFLTQNAGKWLSQRTSCQLHDRDQPPRSHKLTLFQTYLPPADPQVLALCDQGQQDPQQAIGGLLTRWEKNSDRRAGSSLQVLIATDANRGLFLWREALGNTKPKPIVASISPAASFPAASFSTASSSTTSSAFPSHPARPSASTSALTSASISVPTSAPLFALSAAHRSSAQALSPAQSAVHQGQYRLISASHGDDPGCDHFKEHNVRGNPSKPQTVEQQPSDRQVLGAQTQQTHEETHDRSSSGLIWQVETPEFQFEERVWFPGKNLRLRSSLCRTPAGEIYASRFYSEIRMGPA